jgi:hypothetical protein
LANFGIKTNAKYGAEFNLANSAAVGNDNRAAGSEAIKAIDRGTVFCGAGV